MKKIRIFASKVIDDPENFRDVIGNIPNDWNYEYIEELNPDLLEIEDIRVSNIYKKLAALKPEKLKTK